MNQLKPLLLTNQVLISLDTHEVGVPSIGGIDLVVVIGVESVSSVAIG